MDFPNCAALSTCDYSAIAVLAWQWVKQQLGSSASRLYSHWSVILPEGNICRDWVALGSVGASAL